MLDISAQPILFPHYSDFTIPHELVLEFNS